MANEKRQDPINQREKFCIKILLFIVKVLHPYNWEHEFSEVYKSINEEMK
jgi:hypothetical protein